MGKGKDPDPYPYLWLMDPDPGDPRTCESCGSGPGSGPGPSTLVFMMCCLALSFTSISGRRAPCWCWSATATRTSASRSTWSGTFRSWPAIRHRISGSATHPGIRRVLFSLLYEESSTSCTIWREFYFLYGTVWREFYFLYCMKRVVSCTVWRDFYFLYCIKRVLFPVLCRLRTEFRKFGLDTDGVSQCCGSVNISFGSLSGSADP